MMCQLYLKRKKTIRNEYGECSVSFKTFTTEEIESLIERSKKLCRAISVVLTYTVNVHEK
jgi:hypothetical protein